MSMARRQNSTALSCSEKTEDTHPPSRPTNTIMAVTAQDPAPHTHPHHPPPRRKQARDRGGKFAHQRQRHHVSGQRRLPKTHELRAGLQHHDATDEESGEQNDRHRANAHVIHLHERVLKIMRGSREIGQRAEDRKSTRLNSSHGYISYAVFCLKKKKTTWLSTTFSITQHIHYHRSQTAYLRDVSQAQSGLSLTPSLTQ